MFLTLLALLATSVLSFPADTSPNSKHLNKRTFPDFEDWPPGSDADKQQIQNALPDAIDLVAAAISDYTKYKPIYEKYFPEVDHQRAQNVFKNIVSDPNNAGTGEARLKECIIIGLDVAKGNPGGDPCAEGAEAYTIPIPPTLIDPGQSQTATITHFCPNGLKATPRYSNVQCGDLGDTTSVKMDFLGATVMHEWLHNDAVGKAATGVHIEDINGINGYGPTNTRNLRNSSPNDCLKNADSYTWLALEVFWTKKCSYNDIPHFKDPADVQGGTQHPNSNPPSTVQPADPPAAPVCAPVPDGGVKDAHESKAKLVANAFCDRFAKDTVSGPDVNIEHMLWPTESSVGRGSLIEVVQDWTRDDSQDDVYTVSVKSVQDCPVPDGGFNLAEPVSGNKCGDIVYNAFKNCKCI